jgi:hypothetical protein
MQANGFPHVLRVRQRFESPRCEDVSRRVREQLETSNIGDQVATGETVAITAGSRGISNIAEIIKATVEFFVELKAQPFIVPAMGSHGGGTADGQRQVIESYGITESYCGCPIRASMETVEIGRAVEGFPIYFDKFASQADHVVVCGRIKPHTDFAGDIQSGLMKMMMIGLGKKDGAALYHHAIYEHGFPQIVRSVAPMVIAHGKILTGLAIVENAYDDTAHIEAIRPEQFQSREIELLSLAKQWMPKLPFKDIDVLLVDQMGKNISGAGMDTNVIGRKASETSAEHPCIKRIIVRGITPESHGNAAGIGLAEFCLTRVIEQMDREATVLNCLTALDVNAAKIPVHFRSDREVIAAALGTLGLRPSREARLVWIRDTGHLTDLFCSGAFVDEISENKWLDVIAGPSPLPLDSDGMLPDMHCPGVN